MVGIDSHKKQHCMCGAVMRPCRLLMDNGGDDARKSNSEISRGLSGPHQAVSRITSGRVAHPGAFVALLLMGLSAGLSGLSTVCVLRPLYTLSQKAMRAQKGREP